MPKLIKDHILTENEWTLVESDEEGNVQLLGEKNIVPLSTYLEQAEKGLADSNRLAVWLGAADDAEALSGHLSKLALVVIKFDNFMDGRSFSQARTLREHHEFEGEIRAVGGFIQDQLFYLQRCGVNAFELADDTDIESIQESLQDFSINYQGAADDPQPLFRRRT